MSVHNHSKTHLLEEKKIFSEEPLGESLLNCKNSTRVWIPKEKLIVLGRSQKAEKEVNLTNTHNDKIPILKRRGGGGTVFLDSSSLCFTVKYKRNREWHLDNYLHYNCSIIKDFLQENYDLTSSIKKNYDLTINEKKFLGSSLYMSKDIVLYYAVILWHNNAIPLIEKYLCYPTKCPNYRKKRKHREFLIPLATQITHTSQRNFVSSLYQFLTKRTKTEK